MRFVLYYIPILLLISCGTVKSRTVAQEQSSCNIEKNNCSIGSVCVNTFKGKSECKPIPETAPLNNFILPFDKNTEVICTHSMGVGSHSWVNAYYALDLANPYNEPPAIIRASADGTAFVFYGKDGKLCQEPKGPRNNTETDNCGNGWGNRVKILHENGYFSFYVHLSSVQIRNGQNVKQGDPIGIMGATGQAGHRHLHWSVNKLPGSTQSEWEQKITWDGESVPFNFQASVSGKIKTLNLSEIICAHANIGQAAPEEQPQFRGVK